LIDIRDISYIRQFEVFNNEVFNTPIHVIGAGATGSWLTLILAKMGIKNIHVYDFDDVEKHNIPNQAFAPLDIGCSKVSSISLVAKHFAGIDIAEHNQKVIRHTPLDGVVFVLTDTMKSRENIFKACKKGSVEYVIETRMDARGGYIYSFDPRVEAEKERYEKTLYTDEQAEVSACGASTTVIATAMNIATLATWKLINWHNGNSNKFFTAIGLEEFVIYNEE